MGSIAPNAPIVVDGVQNFRSTGGYPAREGVVRAGRLFRSGSLQAITPAGQQVVSELGIRTMIDLRSDAERTGWPNLVWPGVRVQACPILGDTDDDGDADSLEDIYRGIIAKRTHQIAAAVRTIMDAGDTAVVVNCYAGKDRTGIVIAVALLAVGVVTDAVVADYTASASPAGLMMATIDELDRRYGAAAGLLREGGFDDEDIERLHRTLIVS